MATPDIILYVDDEPLVSSYYEKALKMLTKGRPLKVVRFLKAQEAYNHVQGLTAEGRHDLGKIRTVIFDIMMPPEPAENIFTNPSTQGGVKTGIMLYHKLREFPALREIPMFALTNLTDEEVLVEINREKNLDVLSKFDYPPSELVNLVGSKL